MNKKEVVAMILAGGQGSRLGVLTRNIAKPAVPFGGKYRIIDFALSNCINSDVDTVGVLTQYQPHKLSSYIGVGSPWDLDRVNGGVSILPPFIKEKKGEWYRGTADAIYQNMSYIEQFDPDYVLVLSGDHIYKMDYSKMLEYHRRKKAEATIAVIEVPWAEAGRFGIMNTSEDGRIVEFEEKPRIPRNNLASMGIYLFNRHFLKKYLTEDNSSPHSNYDFGKNIIPSMVRENSCIYAYPYKEYWKDVGAIYSLWEANMDLLEDEPRFNIFDPTWRIYSRTPALPPHYAAPGAAVSNSLVCSGCSIYGNIEHSILSPGVHVGRNCVIKDSVIMSGAYVEDGAEVYMSILGEGTRVKKDACIGMGIIDSGRDSMEDSGITVIGEGAVVEGNTAIVRNTVPGTMFREIELMRYGVCSSKAVGA